VHDNVIYKGKSIAGAVSGSILLPDNGGCWHFSCLTLGAVGILLHNNIIYKGKSNAGAVSGLNNNGAVGSQLPDNVACWRSMTRQCKWKIK
jgi:hypothetical protein